MVPPLGFDGDGKTYRVNSDAIAFSPGRPAQGDQADLPDRVRRTPSAGKTPSPASGDGTPAGHFPAPGDLPPELLSKARFAVAACEAGVPRVHIINGREDEGLLAEVFSNEGIGTLIYANEYQQIRKA